ncbi:hypothetical protein TREMEDRAFT_27990 [Tremella mesenterica DSM 1558]|uniref:uncharacterized protein n=1 Tax=Tremella mesenterica (strain ATCC 24925 / CBS 8224 / DSM 1558 / NBRC 9311 / NRRL Y-6157 / RJB 2259-6 / UBC 559-6) TaxID=578456 RepID=UPI0003F498ED|nr:uncharacterized protein TREMEDRAFT_27990 [Tremella mesenterica DSM 1558]EIW71307.1 hypothetical protein TREMEDRAFT_27990 [Tremella mesenterica DSM 1558]
MSSRIPSPKPTESTPLIPTQHTNTTHDPHKPLIPPLSRVLFTSWLLGLTFAFTQTSLVYAFRVMTCEEYYKTHSWTGAGDRCALPIIEARAARSLAIMSTTTTTCTIINLFLTGFWIKKFGPKAAMFQQTAWAALRNLTQIYAQSIGGSTGVMFIQLSQTFNLIGSSGGYQLAGNAFIAHLALAEERTKLFGVLQGCILLGSSVGYIIGGTVYRYFGQLAPFQVTFCLLVFCTIFGRFFLPYVSPDGNHHPSSVQALEKKKRSFLAPLALFLPRRKMIDGKKRWDINLTLLGLGGFFSVLATGYVPMALQLVGTNAFGFLPDQSGVMLSLTLLVKAFFLSLCFPRIIALGRAYFSPSHQLLPPPERSSDDRPDSPLEAEEPTVTFAPQVDTAKTPTDRAHGAEFDLHFLRWSIFSDGCLTACVTASTQGWHLFLAAAVLPFASGTGSAIKGVTLDFVAPEERSDALGAIALIEKLATVSTIGVFGTVFGALSEVGRPTLVFAANAAVAMIAFLLLMFVRFPKETPIALA